MLRLLVGNGQAVQFWGVREGACPWKVDVGKGACWEYWGEGQWEMNDSGEGWWEEKGGNEEKELAGHYGDNYVYW